MVSQGRINFSHGMDDDRKGITGSVLIGEKAVSGWTTYCLPLESAAFKDLEWQPALAASAKPTSFYKVCIRCTHGSLAGLPSSVALHAHNAAVHPPEASFIRRLTSLNVPAGFAVGRV